MKTYSFTTGCPFADDEIAVQIDFDFYPAEPARPNADRPNPGPGGPASVDFVSAKVRLFGVLRELPDFMQTKLEVWARGYLSSDDGAAAVRNVLPEANI